MTGSHAFSLTAVDTLLFRDGRPFGVAEATDVRSLFPPTPHTLQGLIRSRVLETACGRWADHARGCRTASLEPCEHHDGGCPAQAVSGIPGRAAGTLQVRGPWIRVGQHDLLPAPLDLVAASDDLSRSSGAFETAILEPAREVTCNFPGGLMPLQPPDRWGEQKFEGVGGWIAWPAFREYLAGKAPRLERGVSWWRTPDLLVDERRPGVAIDPDRNRARDQHLYFAQHLRMRDGVALAVEVSGIDGVSLSASVPVVPLGGERRVAVLSSVGTPPWGRCPDEVSASLIKEGRAKVVLTQPAWFRTGWHPEQWNADARTAFLREGRLEWVAARIERPDRVGGWDFLSNDQKPARMFVPRGSVFYVQAPPEGRAGVLGGWGSCVSETPDGETIPFSSIGWGHSLLGVW